MEGNNNLKKGKWGCTTKVRLNKFKGYRDIYNTKRAYQ